MLATINARAVIVTSLFMAFLPARADNLSQFGEVDRLQSIERAVHGRQRILETCCTIEQDGALVAANPSVGEALLECRIGRRPLRAEQEAFLARDLVQCRGDRVVRHRDGEAAALTYRPQNEEIADRLRHPDARRD